MSHISNSINTAYKTVLNQAEECNESQPTIALTRESLNTQKVYQENSKRETFQRTVGLEKTLKVIPWNIIAQDFDLVGGPKDWKLWSPKSSFDYRMSPVEEPVELNDEVSFYNDNPMHMGPAEGSRTSATTTPIAPASELDDEPSGIYD